MSFVAYGTRVGIRTNKADVLDKLKDRLPPGWKPAASPVVEQLYSVLVGGDGSRPGLRRFNLLYANASKLVRTMDLNEVFEKLESDLQLFVAEFARRRIFVRAGVVGWRGLAIMIVGPSGSGKSRLVRELVGAGATYYSDEYAVLDKHGRVYPFRRSVRNGDHSVQAPNKHALKAPGLSLGVKPLPLGLVVSSQYSPRAKWRPRQLSPGQGVLALLSYTASTRRQPEASLSALQQALSEATVVSSNRGEATEVVDSLLRFVEN